MNLHKGHMLQGSKYRIERELGHGGFGITYLATQTGLNRKVAIKEFFMSEYCERNAETSQVSVGSSGSREIVDKFRQKFIKEAQTIAALHHPYIIAIHDIFEENGTAYYVMEYHRNGSLADSVRNNGKLPEATAISYIRQLADALSYLHEQKMNHLDVKPGNILLDEKNNAVLIDFGLTKHYDGSGMQTSTTPVGISHGYAPLEQYKRGGVSTFSPETDIYSLGATLYKLVTGTTPPEANDIYEDGLPPLPTALYAPVQNAIKAAMQPRRKERPQSIDEFLALLNGEGTASEETVFPDEDTVSGVIEEPEKPKPVPHPAPEKNEKNVQKQVQEPSIKAEKPKKNVKKVFRIVFAILSAILLIGGAYIWYGYIGIPKEVSCKTPGEAVDLGLSVKWADRNVGATSPTDCGDYFAWGEVKPKTSYCIDGCKTYHENIDDISANSEYDAAAANWDDGWRMPTKAEWRELIDNCTWEWTTQGGKKGYKVTSKKNGNSIFLPAAGSRYRLSLLPIADLGYYWSSTPRENITGMTLFKETYYICFDSHARGVYWGSRADGHSVRPVTK